MKIFKIIKKIILNGIIIIILKVFVSGRINIKKNEIKITNINTNKY